MIKKFVVNRKVFFNYFVDAQYEAGISLYGAEVKSIREGKINIEEGIVHIIKNEAILSGVDIALDDKYRKYSSTRDRKLLLHKNEIKKIYGLLTTKKYRIIPLEFYAKKSLIKVGIGLCRIKKKFDKREAIKKREDNRRIEKLLKKR